MYEKLMILLVHTVLHHEMLSKLEFQLTCCSRCQLFVGLTMDLDSLMNNLFVSAVAKEQCAQINQ